MQSAVSQSDSDDSVSGVSGDIIIAGNYIGTDRTGNAALSNTDEGIRLEGVTAGVTIGGTAAARIGISLVAEIGESILTARTM